MFGTAAAFTFLRDHAQHGVIPKLQVHHFGSGGITMENCTHKNRLTSFVPSSWNEFDSLLNQVLAPTVARTVRGLRAPLSVWEADDAYHIELDVPGVSKEHIDLTFE